MAKRGGEHLPRLSIAPNLNMQQPMGGPAAMFSPALPTSLQQSFHPAFPMGNPLQTPMQSFFNPGIPGAPGRPNHHAHQASIQLAAAGIHPPNFMTPVASHFPRPSMSLAPGMPPQAPSHPFPGRNRRQLSIGGPPKAVLGGPARKLSPMPAAAPGTNASAPVATTEKRKKILVNLPKETVEEEGGTSKTRPAWARSPLTNEFKYVDIPVIPAEANTAEIYPPDGWRLELPNTIDVYLPGKLAWESMKQKDIEEKLEKLGVERGSGSNVPHIHAPHARAASISSPADPALLLFKLNKLHQAQSETSSANNSLPVSPQPPFVQPFGLSPSPHRFITNRHGHTMSLTAQPLSYQSSLFSTSPTPFSSTGVVDNEFGDPSAQSNGIHAPQGRIPVTAPDFNPPPLSAVGAPRSQVDFARGFGLDVPLESEEEEKAEAENAEANSEVNDGDRTQDMELDEEDSDIALMDGDDATTTAPDSRLHSRHVSRISAALSLRSVGGNFQAQFEHAQNGLLEQQGENEDVDGENVADVDGEQQDEVEQTLDPVEEWTGSEDVYLGGAETSDDESIGEYSNPSDEERARQARSERRLRKRAARQQAIDQPRRIPDFPRPPDNTRAFNGEDDIISNPSEENLVLGRRAEFLGVTTEKYYPDSASNLSLPVPHSRVASEQYSAHDPAMAHSRQPSEHFTYSTTNHQSNPSVGKNLNPFAKPFVFGAARTSTGGSGSWKPFNGEATPPMPVPNLSSHSRAPSIGKPLSAAAPEFKPGNFDFRLPGAPQMPLPSPGFPVPQLAPAEEAAPLESSPFRVQGREKRQRRDSSASLEEGDSMASFRFPPLQESSPQAIRRHRSGEALSADVKPKLNPSAQPFTFAGFSAVANNMPWMPMGMPEPDVPNVIDLGEEGIANDSGTARGEESEGQEIEMPVPNAKSRRAPIPLDFKHPVSSATVPAGLFKALASGSGDERTRRGVRSRLSSREIFDHLPRPSMDDNNVALISRKASRNRLVTDPGEGHADDDVFTFPRPHARRRSSLPDALVDRESSPSELSVGPQDLTSRMEMHRLEGVIGQLLDEKLAPLRLDLSRREGRGEAGVSANAESMMADVISLFRAQLQESAAKSLEDSQMDARGELDFQMLREVVEQSHKELLSAFQREIHRIAHLAPMSNGNGNGHGVTPEVVSAIDSIGKRTVHAVVEAISELSARQEVVALNAPSREGDLIVEKVITVLAPMIDSVQNDPIDYEFLTRELAQAVKPEISQLIDLAADKRETASLIVDKILPLLPTLNNVAIDTDAITLKLITEVRRAIAPIDAFEIKEQVADLVVERLDSRLAVRDKAFNVDVVTLKVTESVSGLLESLNTLPEAVEHLSATQKVADERQNGLAVAQNHILDSIAEVPAKVGLQLEQLRTGQDGILEKLRQPTSVAEPDPNVLVIKQIVDSLAADQKKLSHQHEAALSQSTVLAEKLDTLPESFSTIASGLQKTLVEVITSNDGTKRQLEELRQLNTEYQVQLTKARSAHGQARVEKDMLSEKLAIIESDRERLRTQIKELQTSASAKSSETSALEARNTELEDALAKALARLQAADVATQADKGTIADLEKANRDLLIEKDKFKTKATTLEVEVSFVNREKEATIKNFEVLQRQHEQLVSQQGNWEALNAASDKINMVYKLLANADEEDQQELKQQRDRSRALEAENAALQKRVKDAEFKLGNSDKAASTARQTLTQAQQRSTEWERSAKEYEGKLEMVQTQLDQAEQTHAQLEADYNLVKVQLEDHEADQRLVKDREGKLKDQVGALEAKCVRLQSELEKANAAAKMSASPTPFRPLNGNATYAPPRPDSRTSTIYDPAANRRITSSSSIRSSSLASTQQASPSVWDSMHAPSPSHHQNGNGNSHHHNQNGATSRWANGGSSVASSMHAPAGRYPNYPPSTPKAQQQQKLPTYGYNHNPYGRGAPSPTPSVVSVAPTQGEDGWWS